MLAISPRYRIIKPLLGGGMADVFLAEDTHYYNEKVVIKLFKSGLDDSLNRLRKLFEREIQVLSKLDHPHIIKIRDWGSLTDQDNRPYYVMPYMSGGSLQQRIDLQSLFGLAETIDLLQPLADALDYAHKRGVKHLDIKPANILFDAQGRLFLSDFGLALDPDITVIEMAALGTMYYMSPEQFDLERGKLDYRSDLYSLGIVIFQMLTGVIPDKNEDGDPPDVYYHQPALPVGLQPVFDKAMAKDRAMRFDSAGKMLKALQNILDTVSPPAVLASPSVPFIAQQPTARFPPPQRPAVIVSTDTIKDPKRFPINQLAVPILFVLACGCVFVLVLMILLALNFSTDSELTSTNIAQVTESVSQTIPSLITSTKEVVTIGVATSTLQTVRSVEPTMTMTLLLPPTVTSSATPTETPMPTVTSTPTITPTATFRAPTAPAIRLHNLNSCDEASMATFTGFTTIQFEWTWLGTVDTSRGNYLEIRIGPRTGTLVSQARMENEAFFPNNNLWIYHIPAEAFFNSNYYDYEWQIVYMPRRGQPIRSSLKGCFRIIP